MGSLKTIVIFKGLVLVSGEFGGCRSMFVLDIPLFSAFGIYWPLPSNEVWHSIENHQRKPSGSTILMNRALMNPDWCISTEVTWHQHLFYPIDTPIWFLLRWWKDWLKAVRNDGPDFKLDVMPVIIIIARQLCCHTKSLRQIEMEDADVYV